MKRIAKRGLSPIIATTLLISLVVILSTVIFIWARSYFGEQITKFGGPIEDSCKNVDFSVSFSGGILSIANNGNVPIYGVKIYEEGTFGTNDLGDITTKVIFPGKTGEMRANMINNNNVNKIVVVPILLGVIEEKEETKAFACDINYGKNIG
ncbi:MAG: hypothetical protein N3D20_00225 [Candidatus Pacearchaeota archaeon]|nr:hypothetical protein [Candidatus Pacearchaeota archaeon]